MPTATIIEPASFIVMARQLPEGIPPVAGVNVVPESLER